MAEKNKGVLTQGNIPTETKNYLDNTLNIENTIDAEYLKRNIKNPLNINDSIIATLSDRTNQLSQIQRYQNLGFNTKVNEQNVNKTTLKLNNFIQQALLRGSIYNKNKNKYKDFKGYSELPVEVQGIQFRKQGGKLIPKKQKGGSINYDISNILAQWKK